MLTNCHQNLVPPALLTYINARGLLVFTNSQAIVQVSCNIHHANYTLSNIRNLTAITRYQSTRLVQLSHSFP